MVLTCDGSLGFQDILLVLAIDFKRTQPIFCAAELVQIRLTLRSDEELLTLSRSNAARCKDCLDI